MPLQRTYYEILGVLPDASQDDIKKKYRELARKYHPDLVADKALGQKVFAQINMAYRMVGDADRRRQYDATLQPDRGGTVAANRPGVVVGPGSSRATGMGPTASGGPRTGNTTTTATATADPDEVNRHLGEAESALLRAKADEAIAICEAILKMDRGNSRAYGLMGDAHMQQKKYPEAEADYRKSLELAPSSLIRNKLSQLRMLMHTMGEVASDDAPPGGKAAAKPASKAEPQKRGIFPWQRKGK